MGNRAVITLDNEVSKNSIGIYLHWNGGPESVMAFAEAARHYAIRSGEYGAARLAQIIGNYFGGSLSMGISTLGKMDLDNGDNGLFQVNFWADGGVVIKQWTDGDYSKPGKVLDNEKIKKHQYWTASPNILESVIELNKEPFTRKD
jgi:hypothetical protein